MGEVATDWMDTECPEAKRLKVVTPSSEPCFQGLGWGPEGQWENSEDVTWILKLRSSLIRLCVWCPKALK